MTTMQDVAFDLLVVEELYDAVQCEECEQVAHWTWRHDCGEVWLCCQRHRAELDTFVKPETRGGLTAACDICDQPVPSPLPWSAL